MSEIPTVRNPRLVSVSVDIFGEAMLLNMITASKRTALWGCMGVLLAALCGACDDEEDYSPPRSSAGGTEGGTSSEGGTGGTETSTGGTGGTSGSGGSGGTGGTAGTGAGCAAGSANNQSGAGNSTGGVSGGGAPVSSEGWYFTTYYTVHLDCIDQENMQTHDVCSDSECTKMESRTFPQKFWDDVKEEGSGRFCNDPDIKSICYLNYSGSTINGSGGAGGSGGADEGAYWLD